MTSNLSSTGPHVVVASPPSASALSPASRPGPVTVTGSARPPPEDGSRLGARSADTPEPVVAVCAGESTGAIDLAFGPTPSAAASSAKLPTVILPTVIPATATQATATAATSDAEALHVDRHSLATGTPATTPSATVAPSTTPLPSTPAPGKVVLTATVSAAPAPKAERGAPKAGRGEEQVAEPTVETADVLATGSVPGSTAATTLVRAAAPTAGSQEETAGVPPTGSSATTVARTVQATGTDAVGATSKAPTVAPSSGETKIPSVAATAAAAAVVSAPAPATVQQDLGNGAGAVAGQTRVDTANSIIAPISVASGQPGGPKTAPDESAMAPAPRAPPAPPKKYAAVPLAGFPTWQMPSATGSTPCCPHYSRFCHLRAPCCNALVACRRCHDALVPDGHPMDRRAVEAVNCLSCDSKDQPLSESCIFCGIRFASYFCAPCGLYDDTPNRQIFHCDGCGVCRLGERKDYRHCDSCKACLPISSFEGHKCTANVLSKPCSLCKMDMHESVRRCTIPPCGHAMHQGCFEHHVKSSYSCPTCGKSLADMRHFWKQLDRLLEKELVGQTATIAIYCRDCGKVSSAKRHPEFHKCGHSACGSYNTKVKR